MRGVNTFLLAIVFMIAGLAKLGALKAMEDMSVEMAYTFGQCNKVKGPREFGAS